MTEKLRAIMLAFVVLALSACVSVAPITPVVTPTNPNRPMALHTCVPNATVWLDGANVPALRGTTDTNGNIEFPVFPSKIAAFNVHATATGYPEYGAVISTIPSADPLIVILGTCSK